MNLNTDCQDHCLNPFVKCCSYYWSTILLHACMNSLGHDCLVVSFRLLEVQIPVMVKICSKISVSLFAPIVNSATKQVHFWWEQ